MNTPQNLSLLRGSPSFALISVLALVSLAALSATAFLAAARLERLASRPLADVTRLEMVSGTGLAMAMGVLVQAGSTNYGLQRIVTYWRTNEADDLGYLLLGIFANAANPLEVTYLPAFSSASMTNALDPVSTQTQAVATVGQGNFGSVLSNQFSNQWTNGPTNSFVRIPLLGNQTSPPVAWIPIRQERRVRPGAATTTNAVMAQVAFYVQDLQGLIDAERMGGQTNRLTGTNPAEVSLTNLSGTALVSASAAEAFASPTNRRMYSSVGMLVLSNAGRLATNDLRYVATGLRSWGWMSNSNTGIVDPSSFSNRIPPGIQVAAGRGYTNAGQVKFDLNTNLTVGSVSNLVSLLSSNLPNFTNRAGGMAGPTYLSNLAANIVDYADQDSIPTVDTSNVIPLWRGVEAIPWPNEIFTRFNLQSVTTVGTNFRLQLGVKHFVEVWNLSSKSIEIPTNNLTLSNNMDIRVQCSNYIASLTNADPANPPVAEVITNASFVMPPNSYGVLSTATRVYTLSFPTSSVPGGNLNPSLTIPRVEASPRDSYRYTFSYKGVVVDAAAAGRLQGATTNLRTGDFHFISSGVNFGTSRDGAVYNLAGGDPRCQLFMTQPMMSFAYNTTTPGGRNRYAPASGGANIVDPQVNWPDGGQSSSADLVTSPGSANANSLIPQGLQRQGNTNHWIQKAGDNGSFSNLFELGNIFDPIQWGDPNNPFHPRDSAAWMVLSGSCTNFGGAGGRNSLRIGRPEHPRFAFTNFGGAGSVAVPNMGMSAAAMLDLFRIGSADSNSFTGGGKINLNTASRPVLAALAGGVNLTNDPTRAPATAPANANMTNAFAQGVLRFRQLYPFYSPSQVAFISTDYGFGGWTNTWANTAVFSTNAGAGLAGVTALNDEGREEWFSKIHGLTSVDSLNFRCYVLVQLTDAAGNPRGAPYRKYYQIYTVPDPTGPTASPARLPFRPVVVEEGIY